MAFKTLTQCRALAWELQRTFEEANEGTLEGDDATNALALLFAVRVLLDRSTEQTPRAVINWMRALLAMAENECGPACRGGADGEDAGRVYAAIRQLRQGLPAEALELAL